MKLEEKEPLKDYAKGYFKALLSESHPNMRYGDDLTFAIRFQREDGSWYTVKQVTVNKSELDDTP